MGCSSQKQSRNIPDHLRVASETQGLAQNKANILTQISMQEQKKVDLDKEIRYYLSINQEGVAKLKVTDRLIIIQNISDLQEQYQLLTTTQAKVEGTAGVSKVTENVIKAAEKMNQQQENHLQDMGHMRQLIGQAQANQETTNFQIKQINNGQNNIMGIDAELARYKAEEHNKTTQFN